MLQVINNKIYAIIWLKIRYGGNRIVINLKTYTIHIDFSYHLIYNRKKIREV